MSAFLLVLTLVLIATGLTYMALVKRTGNHHWDVIGLTVLNAAGIVAACYAAVTSL